MADLSIFHPGQLDFAPGARPEIGMIIDLSERTHGATNRRSVGIGLNRKVYSSALSRLMSFAPLWPQVTDAAFERIESGGVFSDQSSTTSKSKGAHLRI
jgi:hypothetical protein